MAAKATFKRAFDEIREAALAFPQTHEDFPWGHSAFKVAKKKAFCFLVLEPGRLSLSCKLPSSNGLALTMPYVEPTRYGLAKSGWVTATFDASTAAPPVGLLKEWLAESYRAIAPKTVLKSMTDAPAKSKSKPARRAK